MSRDRSQRRPYGSGALFEHRGSWYGQWRVRDRLLKRKVGPIRQRGSSTGLTKGQAEAKLRQLIETTVVPGVEPGTSLNQLGDRYVNHVEHVLHRKPSTIQD